MKNDKYKSIVILNKELNHKYEVVERIECGIELKGTEVKSIREGKATLKDSFALVTRDNEIVLKNMHITHYDYGNINNVPEKRDRKLLLHRLEILKILNNVKQGGFTLIPYKLYQSGKYFKIELCICKGKKLFDKRDKILQSEVKRQINTFKRS